VSVSVYPSLLRPKSEYIRTKSVLIAVYRRFAVYCSLWEMKSAFIGVHWRLSCKIAWRSTELVEVKR